MIKAYSLNIFINNSLVVVLLGFPGGTVVKNPPAIQEMSESWV